MASSYLTRTVTASSATSYTVSFWIKINNPNWSSSPYLFTVGSTAGNGLYLASADRKIKFFRIDDSAELTLYDGKLQDVNGWYNIVWSVNSGTGTAYVNGITGNSHSGIPALNNNSGTKINIHAYSNDGYNDLDCCMAHFHFIDGTAYDASDFGQFNSDGVWTPKSEPSVTYGTNGFFLKFENSGSMGTDSSGNANNFTVNGSVTQTLDTPSNVYCTINALNIASDGSGTSTLSNGNLTVTSSGTSQNVGTLAPALSSGSKWYYEFKNISGVSTLNSSVGWSTDVSAFRSGNWATSGSLFLYASVGNVYSPSGWLNGVAPTYSNNDIISCTVDLQNNEIKWYKNNSLAYTLSNISFVGDVITPHSQWSQTGAVGSFNFGNGYFGTTAVASAGSNGNGAIFEYDVPSGFYALNTKNLATYG